MKRVAGRATEAGTRGRTGAPPARGFLIRFVAGTLAGIAAIAWIPALSAVSIAFTVRHAATAGRLLGWPVRGEGETLAWNGLRLEIVPDCTPLVPMVLLASAILAYPAPWRRRAAGIAAVWPLLWLYNLARVLAMVAVVERRPGWFEFTHVYLWQAVTLAACVGLFALWLPLAAAPPSRAARAPVP